MDKENYRKVVKICEKGRYKVRENSFGVCWCVRCGKLHSDAAEKWYGNSHKVFQISEEDFNKVVETKWLRLLKK